MDFRLLSFLKKEPRSWRPLPHTVIKDAGTAEIIHQEGFVVAEALDESQIQLLQKLYASTHDLKSDEGGMFYGMYSLDMAYRKKVHDAIAEILTPVFESFFKDYKNIVNFFITKLPGPKSELNIHQDMTAMDETKYSPLSVWIPLQDVTEENGALCVMPRSHFMLSPYRSISFEAPYGHLSSEIIRYLRPIRLKAGQVLIFDPRILHHSLPNLSSSPRVAIVAGIFPEEAEIITCFKEPEPSATIELLLQPDDFMFTNDNFFHHCTDRPKTGQPIARVGKPMPALTLKAFRKHCQDLDIQPYDKSLPFYNNTCHMIGEPLS
jgi:hypothetical protein